MELLRGAQTARQRVGVGTILAALACLWMAADSLAHKTPIFVHLLTLLPVCLLTGLALSLLILRPWREEAQTLAVYLIALGVLARSNLSGLSNLVPFWLPHITQPDGLRPGYLFSVAVLGTAPLAFALRTSGLAATRPGRLTLAFVLVASGAAQMVAAYVLSRRLAHTPAFYDVLRTLSPYHRLLVGGFPVLLVQHSVALWLLSPWGRNRGTHDERGLRLFFIVCLVFLSLTFVNDLFPSLPTILLSHAAGAAIPVSLVYALERYGLFNLRVRLARVVQYALARSVLAALTVLPLMAMAFFLGLSRRMDVVNGYAVFPPRSDLPFDLALACGVAACVSAAMLAAQRPLLNWFARTYFREKYDAQRVLEGVTRSLLGRTDAREIARDALDGVCRVLHPENAYLLGLEPDEGGEHGLALLACYGETEGRTEFSLDSSLLSLRRVQFVALSPESDAPDVWLDALPVSVRASLARADVHLAVPLMETDLTTGLLLLGPRRSGLDYTPEDADVLRAIAPQISLALQGARLTREFARRRTAELAARSAGFVELVERERRLLAADLHDQTLPELRCLLTDLEGMEAQQDEILYPVPDVRDAADTLNTKQQALGQMAAHLRQTIANIRDIMESLRPSALEVLGLVPALEGELRQAASRARPRLIPRFRVEEGAEPIGLTSFEEVSVFRIAQEAVNNACRHAGASTVALTVALDGNEWLLRVEDDGVGMPAFPRAAGHGLSNMQYRAGLVGGRLTWRATETGGGTRVELRLPLKTRLESDMNGSG